MHFAYSVPAELRSMVAAVDEALSRGEQAPPVGMREVRVAAQLLQFPYRTYYSPETLAKTVNSFDGEAKAWCLAMCTRHWDGHVREWAALALDPTGYSWGRAFALQLLGEYVVEIAEVIEEKINTTGPEPYLSFIRENPAFLATTRRRATSYWNCYYRSAYQQLRDFPSYRAVAALEHEALGAA